VRNPSVVSASLYFPLVFEFVDFMLVMVMTQSNLIMALASPNPLVTLVPVGSRARSLFSL
jgi:hypothetical protein